MTPEEQNDCNNRNIEKAARRILFTPMFILQIIVILSMIVIMYMSYKSKGVGVLSIVSLLSCTLMTIGTIQNAMVYLPYEDCNI